MVRKLLVIPHDGCVALDIPFRLIPVPDRTDCVVGSFVQAHEVSVDPEHR
jgi:hypothetical protein